MGKKDSDSDSDSGKGLGYWLVHAFFGYFILLFLYWWWPSIFPFGLYDFWIWDSEKIIDGVKFAWPIFLWGFSVTLLTILLGGRLNASDRELTMSKSILYSVMAGVLEETIFRWIVFYLAIPGVYLGAFLFFGWISESLELGRLFYWYIVAPVINFFSLETMDWMLYDKGWAVGAAIVGANTKFRDEHKYLGWGGYVNSFVIGFWLFSIMFHYGLPAAIFVHFLYDLIIFGMVAIHVKLVKIKEGIENEKTAY